MEIDARTIREVEFREKIRGYNPDDVDDFLEQVAVAFEVIEDRLRSGPAQPAAVQPSAVTQVETRETRAGTSIVSSPLDRSKTVSPATSEFDADTIQRTLLLAQKTADATIKAAEEQAEITVGEAKAKADVLISQAMHRAREIVDDAVNQARDEVLDLAKSKDKLLSELNQLNSRLAGARDQMKHLLEGVMDQIEGSFAPVSRTTELASAQPADPGPPDHAETTLSSSAQLFNEPGYGNSSGVFDDELE
ncbi:MAG: DivIVA domain-containing protein [Acidimicrobiaceae bacterium]|nr:DivIVA domain-containing protein [Acidimicrobiaceae bacterium]